MTTETLEKNTLQLRKLKDQVAIVTGGTRGIGKAIAELYARHGAQVIITGRAEANPAADELNSKLSPEDGQVTYMGCNISSKEAIADFVKTVIADFGQIDILVNNAGITKDTLLMRMKEDEWNAVIDTNLNSLFHICQPVVKAMSKKRSGAIINMSSVVGVHGNPAQTNYSASKAGMIGFTKSLAKEYGRRGIRANVIAPGFIATEMTDELPEEVIAKYKENIPLGEFGIDSRYR